MLDIKTIAILSILSFWVVALVQFLCARKYPDYIGQALQHWSCGFALAGVWHLLLLMHRHIPVHVTIVATFGLAVLVIIEYNVAIRTLRQEKPFTAYYAGVAVPGVLLLNWFEWVQHDAQARELVANIVIMALLVPLCRDLFKDVSRAKRSTYWSAGILFGWIWAVMLVRTVNTLHGDYVIHFAPLDRSAMQTVLFGSTFIVAILAGYLFMLMASDEFAAQINRLAAIDALTEILNRRTFEDLAGRLLQADHRRGIASCLLMLDLDNFKAINDRFGHPTGDAVLRAVAETIMANMRAGDVFGRYGGEEFCMLLPDTSVRVGLAIAERLRREIEKMAVAAGDNTLRLTVSIGVAATTGRDKDLNVLFAESDQALYRAKANGRNRVATI